MIKLDKVSKKFGTGVFGLSDVSFSIDRGEFVFLVGPTGAGKTTIFRLLIRDILPSEGSVTVNDWDVVTLPKSKIPLLRKKIGFVFQDLKLLLDRTIFENIALPLEVVGVKTEEALKTVEDILAQVGLTEHKDKFPIQLSGGELQRTAIARALVLSPEILLADEPTGNLDAAMSWEIVKLLSDINKKGTTVVMATHNRDIVKSLGKRTIHIEKGKIVDDEKGSFSVKVKTDVDESEEQEKKDPGKHKEDKDDKVKLSEAKVASAGEEKKK
jgi:cell division transport system ATP-binding protein